MKNNIVILGATGTVGRKVAELLLHEGHKLSLVARHTESLEALRGPNARIVAGDVTDTVLLTELFSNADSAFLILPDNVKAEDFRAYQRQVTGALIEAIQRSDIKYIVNMSSVGSHQHEGNGIMAGTGEQEVRLNQLEGVNVLHVRSAYFMENFLRTIGLVKNRGINGTVATGDRAIPMVATRDVARVIAGHLAAPDWTGKQVEAVMGPRDYTYREFTTLIGSAIGQPDLPYVQIPVPQAKEIFLGNGFSEDFVDNLIEMGTAVETGFMNYQPRTTATITPTTAEEFISEVYTPLYRR
ncbi:NmrA family NAD(P)-binding protein [Neolewinella xylanilytica]|nr:NAD(P)H-binding protein [Neolewinella xylanilytica]